MTSSADAETIQLAGRVVEVAAAAEWLVEEYPLATVKLYDLGDRQRPDIEEGGIRIWTDPRTITLEDIGRATVLDAQFRGWGAADLATAKVPPESWSRVPPAARLDDDEMAFEGPLYRHANELYGAFLKNTARAAWVSKILHLKRPALFPIVDSRVARFYREQARAHARVHGQRGSLFWLAIREDLREPGNRASLVRLRGRLAQHELDDHANRLLLLTDLRLLDMIVWGLTLTRPRKPPARPTRRLEQVG